MFILVLYVGLILSTLALLGVALALYVRVKKHMKATGETGKLHVRSAPESGREPSVR